MNIAYSIFVAVLLWRFAVPMVLGRSEKARTLLTTSAGEWLFFVSEGAPTLLFFIFKLLIPNFDPPSGFARGPLFVGHYQTASCPAPTESAEHFLSRMPELWHQDYYYLNLLNRRSVTLLRQRRLSLPEAQSIAYDPSRLQVAATRKEAQ